MTSTLGHREARRFSSSIIVAAICLLSAFSHPTLAEANSESDGEYRVSERGAHHRVWERVTLEETIAGRVARTDFYTELASGLHYADPDTGAWRESHEQFDITPEGYAVASRGQHRVILSPQLNDAEGAVDLQTPDGRRLRSTVLALNLYNRATGDSMFVAEVSPDAVGRQVAPNEILFTNAFAGFSASVRYVYNRGDWRQEVLPQERLDAAALATAGFPVADSVLEIWTEFFEAPEPLIAARIAHREHDPARRAQMAEPDIITEDLDFGAMKLPGGRAYLKGGEGAMHRDVTIFNRWLRIGGRAYLVESIRLDEAMDLFAQLPAGGSSSDVFKGKSLHAGRRVPTPLLARKGPGTILTAQAGAEGGTGIPPVQGAADRLEALSHYGVRRPGREIELVMDSVTINGSLTNVVLAGDQTYYVSGETHLYGTNVLEGGAVVKYARNANAQLRFYDKLECRTAPYRPAVFTAKDDNSVGQTISGSSGSPSGYYPYAALAFFSPVKPVDLHDIRVSYANYGVLIAWGGSHAHSIRDGQFVRNSTGVYVDYTSVPATLRNLLLHQSSLRAVYGYGATVHAEHLTIHEANRPFDGGTVNATNSLFVSITNWPTAFTSVNNATNSGGSVFQTVGAGAHYLTNQSTYREAGTTNINAELLVGLARKTTYPPAVLTNAITSDTTLSTNVPRGFDIAPALGYHYDPIDYAVSNLVVTNATLVLTNGVAVGVFGSTGIKVTLNGHLSSSGAAMAQNWLMDCRSVQEQAVPNLSGPNIVTVSASALTSASTQFRFTSWAKQAGGGTHFKTELDSDGNEGGSHLFRDCRFSGGALAVYDATASIDNCLFERSYIELWEELGQAYVYTHNCTFFKGTLNAENQSGQFVFKDNFFHGTLILAAGNVSHDYNAYVEGFSRIDQPAAGDVSLTNFTYASGPLGNYYHGAANLMNAGSRDADEAGLFHYTTTTNQTKELGSVVDIGFHYVALNAAGQPKDTDLDGLPDYLADANGNGAVDTGETDWGVDTDLDGLPDSWETRYGLNPLLDDADDDPDGDWISNLDEYNNGTNPRDVMVIAWGDNSDGQCDVPLDLRNVVAVAGGLDFSLALRSDGTVVGWGGGAYGETNIPGGWSNGVSIVAGTHHAQILREDGNVTAWGAWWHGGDPAFTSLTTPDNLTNLVSLAAGAEHGLALRADGEVLAWGYDTNASFALVPPSVTNAASIAAGWNHSVARLPEGTLVAWGDNFASLGWNVTNVPAGLSNVTAVAAGAHHTLALIEDGTVAAWGAGEVVGGWWADLGQSIVPAGLSNVAAISAGGYHSMALRSDGTLAVWGDLPAPSILQSNVVAIGAGANHGLAIRSGRLTPLIVEHPADQFAPVGSNVTFTAQGLGLAGVTYQWQLDGVNIEGATNAALTLTDVQAADEGVYRVVLSTGAGSVISEEATFTLVTAPVIVFPTEPQLVHVPDGGSFALTATVSAAGQFEYPLTYQWQRFDTNLLWFSAPGYTNSFAKLPAEGLYRVIVTNIVGAATSAVWEVRVKAPGTVSAWGSGEWGQTNVPFFLGDVQSLAAGEFHSVAVKEDGTVVQWGFEWDDIPADLTNAVAVAAGYWHTLALREDGTVVSWGDPESAANTVPTNLAGVKAIAAGWNHNVALLTNGTVTAWGVNGTNLGWYLLEVPADLTNATAVAAGALFSVALRSDGKVAAWGFNGAGQTNVPAGLSNVVAIAAGGQHALAVKEDGTVAAWGDNGSGQCDVPAGLSNVIDVAAGWAHSVARKNDGPWCAGAATATARPTFPSTWMTPGSSPRAAITRWRQGSAHWPNTPWATCLATCS